MKRSIIVLILAISISLLFSQNFPPPQNLRVELFNDIPHLIWDPPNISTSSKVPTNRDLIEYCVYEDGAQLAFVQDIYSLYFFSPGTYSFFVTAIYADPSGESVPSNTVIVTISFSSPENLTAVSQGQNIYIEWNTPINGTYLTNYKIYRNGEFIIDTTENNYLDESIAVGTYSYYVIANYYGNLSEPSNTVTIDHTLTGENLIMQMNLLSNHPNPFNPSTTIKYSIQNDSKVELSVFNIKGQIIKILANNEFTKGKHSIIWYGKDESGKSVSSGVYYYKLRVNGKTEVANKCLLLK